MKAERFLALVDRGSLAEQSRQFAGLPPELTAGEDFRVPLPSPDVLVVETEEDGIFLIRFTRDGEFGGDTWHESVYDAMAQARFEYGEAVGDWSRIPAHEEDAQTYALRAVRDA